ncbi:MAG: polyribonucleotide nucleotidyltransferase [Armatimonadetes bacterium]|nr:polyribonucleotide nucleotidyltransferase [Armatimonadota bacterium]
MIEQVEMEVGGRKLTIQTGELAKQADGSVLVTMGDTHVLATATMSATPRAGVDFFPLSCDYEERKYAVGKIPGGFVKRGGRPSEKAITTSRLIDRPLRPLFPDGMRHEVQVIAIPLSFDRDIPGDVLAITGASAALSISRIPFAGPIAAVRMARIEGEWVINPSLESLADSDLNMVVAGTRDTVTTVDADAKGVTEDEVIEAVRIAHDEIRRICELQDELVKKVGQPKAEVELHKIDEELLQAVRDAAGQEIMDAIQQPEKAAREEGIRLLNKEIVDRMAPDYPERESELAEAVDKIVKQAVRTLIFEKNQRPDGRRPDEVRPISCRVGLLPRVHGSGLFTRGQTQALTTLTLGALDDAQMVDTLEEDGYKRYMHFYNFLPFSTGETKMMRGPGRREVGHGVLAEKALTPMIPPQEEFPYALLLTSEILESNGSSSMASVCGSTLALMDAGVKLKAPVAGAAMGLMSDGDKYVILSDIMGMEDFSGDMDFKVAGTADGITAIQMDTKIEGISMDVVRDALAQARNARLHILGEMMKAISEPREEMSPYAPRVLIIEIHPEKIGDVIGPGGKVIKKIEAETGASISIEQDGHVYITAVDKAGGEAAYKMVDDITRDVRPGETYVGTVTRTMPFGAFVEILPGREGLVHISELAPHRVERTEDICKVGDELLVKVIELNPQGKISLTRKGCTEQGGETGQGQDRPRGGDGGRRDDHRRGDGRHDGPRREPQAESDDSGMPRATFRPKR